MNDSSKAIATLAGGCFWCLEAVFEQLQWVMRVQSGYSGGHVPNPSYEQVCTDTTGHAEVVHVHFDPTVGTFRDLLRIFFSIHDPTTLNRQGHDVGIRYRSAVFYHDDDQKAAVHEMIGEMEKESVGDGRIVTEVVPFEVFYLAEEYHQEYYRRNLNQPYCQWVIAPKLAKFRDKHLTQLKS